MMSPVSPRSVLASDNPFDGVHPNFSIFGAHFTHMWQVLLGGVWAVALIICAVKLIIAGLSMHNSRNRMNPVGVGEATKDLQMWGLSTGVIVAAPVVFGAMLLIFGT